MQKIINKMGQLAGKIEDGEVTTYSWDLQKAMKGYVGEGTVQDFLKRLGFKIYDDIQHE